MEENRNNFKKSGNGANVLADIVAENLGADRYGADRNHINLDDALRNSREYVSPVDVGRAEDDCVLQRPRKEYRKKQGEKGSGYDPPARCRP